MSYIIVSEYLIDCIGHVNRVSVSNKKRQREVKKGREAEIEAETETETEAEEKAEAEEEVGLEGGKHSLVGAQEIKMA